MLVEFIAVEADDTVTSCLFRDVQRVVRGAHQRLAVGDTRVWPRRYAEARRAPNRGGFERECMCLDLFSHPLGEGNAGIEDRPRQKKHELFATVAPDAVDLAHFVAKNACELLEHGVARLVAIC